MKERPDIPEEEQPYYNTDAEIGQVHLWDQEFMLRLHAHVGTEAYYGQRDELIPLSAKRGERTYVHAKPYILVPDFRLTIQLNRESAPSGHIGNVVGGDWPGMNRRDIGNAQAWYYPEEQTIILWECFLNRHHTPDETHANDPNLRTLWQGFEHFLTEHFPEAQQLVTTHDDPLYETPDYQRFIGEVGYRRINPAAFAKAVRRG